MNPLVVRADVDADLDWHPAPGASVTVSNIAKVQHGTGSGCQAAVTYRVRTASGAPLAKLGLVASVGNTKLTGLPVLRSSGAGTTDWPGSFRVPVKASATEMTVQLSVPSYQFAGHAAATPSPHPTDPVFGGQLRITLEVSPER